MYIPAAFKETREEVLFELIENYPLGTLITQHQGDLDAIHIPFEVVQQQAGESRGLFGVNLGGIPGANYHWSFSIFCGLLVLLVGGVALWMKRSKWL